MEIARGGGRRPLLLLPTLVFVMHACVLPSSSTTFFLSSPRRSGKPSIERTDLRGARAGFAAASAVGVCVWTVWPLSKKGSGYDTPGVSV